MFKADIDKIVGGGSGKTNKMVMNLFKKNKSKNLTYILNIATTKEPIFLISDAKKAFNYLWPTCIKTLIL